MHSKDEGYRVGDRVVCPDDRTLGTIVEINARGWYHVEWDDGKQSEELPSEIVPESFKFPEDKRSVPMRKIGYTVIDEESGWEQRYIHPSRQRAADLFCCDINNPNIVPVYVRR